MSVMLGNYLQQTTSADNIFRCIFFLGTLRVNVHSILTSNIKHTAAKEIYIFHIDFSPKKIVAKYDMMVAGYLLPVLLDVGVFTNNFLLFGL